MTKEYLLYDRYINIRAGALDIGGLDATFNIEKNIQQDPNKCELRVFNLSQTNRKALQELQNVVVEIRAGYKGLQGIKTKADAQSINLNELPETNKDDEFLIFSGDIVQVYSQKEGPDWITTLRTADGAASFQKSRFNQTYKTSKTIGDIVTELLEETSLDTTDAIKKIQEGSILGTARTVLNAHTVQGSVHRELDKKFTELNVSGYIQDGAFVVLKQGETLGTEAVTLTPDTGLLGSPEVAQDGLLHCTSLIRPELILGHQLKLESFSTKGVYRIERIAYVGSTFSNEWYAEITASPL